MHILYFHQHFTTPTNAGGTRSFEMARALIADGHQVTMVCGTAGIVADVPLRTAVDPHIRQHQISGITVLEIGIAYSNELSLVKRTLQFLRYAWAASRIAVTHRCDLIFATTTPLTVGIPALAARWLRGKPYVFEVRDLWPELPRAMGVIRNPVILALLSLLEFLSYRNAERCVALSPGIAKGIESRGVSPDQIAMVPNGCDLQIFADATERWRPESVPTDALMVIFTGTHGPANGLEAVLDAADELKRRSRADIAIVLVGDGKNKRSLVDRAKEDGLDNVHFHAPVSKLRLAGLMAAADVGLQVLANVPAFYYGTSPNKFFDYLAAGLPVVTNYPGWVADLLNESGAGMAVRADDAASFADALCALADDRSALPAMASAATQLARTQFARETLARRWVAWVTRGVTC